MGTYVTGVCNPVVMHNKLLTVVWLKDRYQLLIHTCTRYVSYNCVVYIRLCLYTKERYMILRNIKNVIHGQT